MSAVVIALIAVIVITSVMLVRQINVMRDNRVSVEAFVYPPMPNYSPTNHLINEEWEEYKRDAYNEYEDMFTELFNSYETKWSKNNRLMIRQGSNGSYKFVKKG
ncbi:hypothetical protein [Streptomyces hebeiensis]